MAVGPPASVGVPHRSHGQALRAALAERYAPASVNKHLAALRRVLAEAWRLGLVCAEDYHRAADVAGVRGERLAAGRGLSGGELRALFGACARDPTPAVRGTASHPEDDLVLATALSASAEFLVTGDRQLQRLGTFQDITILSANQFLALLRQGEPKDSL